jgi:GTP-binding protein Era
MRDTPGISKRYKYSRFYVTKAWGEINGSDIVLFVVDGLKNVDGATKEALRRLNMIKTNLLNEEMIKELSNENATE